MMAVSPLAPLSAATLALLVAAIVGCGNGDQTAAEFSEPSAGRDQSDAAQALGFPLLATKNTLRVSGADSFANAAAAASAVYTAQSTATRPQAVVLAPIGDWRIGLAASSLMGPPLRAPLLYTDADSLPPATQGALDQLRPPGARTLAGAQVIRVGTKAELKRKTQDIRGSGPAKLARSIDAFGSTLRKAASDRVIVVSADDPKYAMPAAAWAARSGDPILFTNKNTVPADTVAALRAHQRPKIYLLGPESVISKQASRKLATYGAVTRISGTTPVTNAIAFARFIDGPFGWGILDPGHGMVIVGLNHPTDAAAVAPLSASGSYGPLLITDNAKRLPPQLRSFLLDIQPGFPVNGDPARGVYNRAWVIGDKQTITVGQQAVIDALLEIIPIDQNSDENSSLPTPQP